MAANNVECRWQESRDLARVCRNNDWRRKLWLTWLTKQWPNQLNLARMLAKTRAICKTSRGFKQDLLQGPPFKIAPVFSLFIENTHCDTVTNKPVIIRICVINSQALGASCFTILRAADLAGRCLIDRLGDRVASGSLQPL